MAGSGPESMGLKRHDSIGSGANYLLLIKNTGSCQILEGRTRVSQQQSVVVCVLQLRLSDVKVGRTAAE